MAQKSKPCLAGPHLASTFNTSATPVSNSGSGTANLDYSHSHPSSSNPQPTTLTAPRPDRNIGLLPYQPLSELSASLSAADLHVVVMGNPFVGLVHPCKIYNILSTGAPVLCIGPTPSHLSDILSRLDPDYPCASVRHGQVDQVISFIQTLRSRQPARNLNPSSPARDYSKSALLPQLVSLLES